ncbi:MAG TPA: class I SAM-dependent rRNA methyltransferase [Candidatus Angelobacter sp.]
MSEHSSAPPKISVSPRAVGRLRSGHLWIYASDVLGKNSVPPGALVEVNDSRGKLQGSALYSSSSQIKLRMLTREALGGEHDLLRLISERLQEAVAYRRRIVRNSDAYRVVFSEADGLPGLIIDRYNDVYTIQVLTQAWDQPERRATVVWKLQELTGAENIAERVDERIRELEQLPALASGLLHGSRSQTIFTMNGAQFHYDALAGQKTGGFLDQRENYAAAVAVARGEALDVCTYQGGFALHLARSCEKVTAIDISREALEIAEKNEKLNASANKREIEWMEANAFDLLKDYSTAGRQYDVIVLDPPAFARTKRNLDAAMRGYKELNLRALKMLRPGGILVTCSCSFHVSESDFLEAIASAAVDARRSVRILEKRTQSSDHPILMGIPETYYLKCLICSVS